MKGVNRYGQSDKSRRYDDILKRPHHRSLKHPSMPMLDRAAQFAPFAALTGHGDALKETARLTDRKIDLDENEKAVIDRRLRFLRERAGQHPHIAATYFIPDRKKEGGACATVSGTIKRFNEHERKLLLMDGTVIAIDDLLAIESPLVRGVDI